MSINTVAIAGNLTRDPQLRHTQGGTAVCTLGVAVNERVKDAMGNWDDRANFFDVTVWGARGEACAKYLKRGRGVVIKGRLRWHSWEKDGQKRSKVDIVCEDIDWMPERDGGGGGGGEQGERSQQESGSGSGSGSYSSADDDIPF